MRGSPLQPQKQVAAEEDGTAESLRRSTAARGTGLVGGLGKKAVGIRSWLLLDSTGQAQVAEVGKSVIMRLTGLPASDIRNFDLLSAYRSTVLGRERAIVIHLEHIKAIITAQEVFLLNSKDPPVVPFVDELQRRILRHHQAVKAQEAWNGENPKRTNSSDQEGAHSSPVSPPHYSKNVPGKLEGEKAEGKEQPVENRDGPKLLPFEFVALAACLEAACSCLDSKARTLEQEAHLTLDELTSNISTLKLERVLRIKTRLVAIIGCVEKVRYELKHLLYSDEDMAKMYLTEKQVENSSISTLDDNAALDARIPTKILEGNEDFYVEQRMSGARNVPSRGRHSSTHSAMNKPLELEMLLEAYLVQIERTLNKLYAVREYVDDTEDYINIMLDDKQNHILRMDVMLTTATLVLSAFVAVAGIFGMNISIGLFQDDVHGMTRFISTVGGGTAATIFLYVMAIAWYNYKGLLEWLH